ncbi:mRNA interferase MazF [Modicisalibacter ilicicola DSM 19980]|uniref:mRNA interferase n=1 Tax=Modicisalibacter ilicicola DSM 19980 TaxID=1121942 RepID=A0A1M4WHH3_9GAMM|nr:type II toxin-antitoxin system PemK/MazF family toxin [Halomonas ilicicola]SHE80751.1 mRNA interferase MazF [Halomonas ilicicola DSM 19980]
MQRGEIWVANLNPNKGKEIGKARPVVILQADELLESALSTLVVVPLTTQYRPTFKTLRIEIAPRDRLLKTCYAMAEHPRTLDRRRLSDGPLALLTDSEMSALEKSLKAVMGLL